MRQLSAMQTELLAAVTAVHEGADRSDGSAHSLTARESLGSLADDEDSDGECSRLQLHDILSAGVLQEAFGADEDSVSLTATEATNPSEHGIPSRQHGAQILQIPAGTSADLRTSAALDPTALLPAAEDSTASTVPIQEEMLDRVFHEWAQGMLPSRVSTMQQPDPSRNRDQGESGGRSGWVPHNAANDAPPGGHDLQLFMAFTDPPAPGQAAAAPAQQSVQRAASGNIDSGLQHHQPSSMHGRLSADAEGHPGLSQMPTGHDESTQELEPQQHQARLVATAIASAASPQAAPAVAAASLQGYSSAWAPSHAASGIASSPSRGQAQVRSPLYDHRQR